LIVLSYLSEESIRDGDEITCSSWRSDLGWIYALTCVFRSDKDGLKMRRINGEVISASSLRFCYGCLEKLEFSSEDKKCEDQKAQHT